MTVAPAPHAFQSALLLVEDEANAVVDRRALREAGVPFVRVHTSGLQAARLLAGKLTEDPDYRPDLILCHARLSDMSAAQFAALIQTHPRLVTLPLLIVVGNDTEGSRMEALASGFTGLLVRPYSPYRLFRQLQALSTPADDVLREGKSNLDTGAFDAALQQYELARGEAGSPESAFKLGLQELHNRQWEAAIQAFQRALRQMELKGEAEIGLAAAWRGKGNMAKYHYYLNEAGHTFARALQWHRARVVYARLLRTAPTAPSPFLNTAEGLIRAGKFEEAAAALAQGYDLGPLEDVPNRLAQALMTTENPEDGVDRLRRFLDSTTLADMAAELEESTLQSLAKHTQAAQARRLLDRSAPIRVGIPTRTTLEEFSAEDTIDEDKELSLLPDSEVMHRHSSASPPQSSARHSPSRPLREEDASTGLFSTFPWLNEILTVIKVTRKLASSGKK